MPEPKRKSPAAFVPLAKIVVSDVPVVNAGRKKPDYIAAFEEAIKEVRKLEGRTALILQHPKPNDFVRKMKEHFLDIQFIMRKIDANGTPTIGVWARTKTPAEMAEGTANTLQPPIA